MKIKYKNYTVKKQCTEFKTAKRLFGGNEKLTLSLLSRINALESADSLKDIIVQPQFRFHN